MDPQGFPCRTTCGLRKLTPNHLAAAKLAEQAPGLPPGLRHPNQLLAALRRAAPYLGHTRLLPLMEALFRWTQPQDWASDAEPVVWPSNDMLALTLDCSERHVSRLIAAAVEARLILPKDGPDRRRRGLRREGRILWAWGLSLRPMAARHADFLAAAEQGEHERRARQELRRQAAAARQFVTRLAVLSQEQGAAPAPLEALATRARALAAPLRRLEDLTALKRAVAAMQELAAEAREAFDAAVENADMSGSGDAGVRPMIPTDSSFEPERLAVAAREAALGGTLPAQAVDEASPAVSPTELVALAPRLGAFIAARRPGWGDIVEAAPALARHLDVTPALYGEACRLLGRCRAALALAIVSARPEEHFHTAGAGGYLRGMLRRAQAGELCLERSLHGMRERRRRQLTAVNSDWTSAAGRGVRYPVPHATATAYANGTHG